MSFDALVKKGNALSPPYLEKIKAENEFWEGSPFDWIRHLSSRTRGKIGQDLVRSIFEQYGYSPVKRRNSFEIKGKNLISRYSTPWELTAWQFQQVRNTTFDYLFCLANTRDSASAWLIPKGELYSENGDKQDRSGWGGQHGGRSGNEDGWLVIPTNKPAD